MLNFNTFTPNLFSAMRKLIYLLIAVSVLTGCSINNSIMLKTPRDYQFDPPPLNEVVQYKISSNDLVQFRLFTNDGFKLIDLTSLDNSKGNNNIFNARNNFTYLVEHDGFVKLPILGKIKLEGLTIREAETMLEEAYQAYYKRPFVMLNVTNKRVIIFPGNAGAAQVITLGNNNTTLMEAIAQAGGLAQRGKAKEIKLIRTVGNERKTYLLDLSKIEGLPYGDIVVQANDIIYVEPVPELARELLRDITPLISLMTSALLVYATLTNLQ